MSSRWQKNLASLRTYDVYVLVMVDQAGIPRPKPSVRQQPSANSPQMLVGRVPDVAAGLVAALGIVYFIILKMEWGRGGPPILGNVAERLLPMLPNEQVR